MFNTETIIIRTTCPCCGTLVHVHALESQYNAWLDGALVQDAFPDMSITDRESLISGLCSKCQAIFFNEEMENEEEE